ncbi:hypothetical protein SEA_CHEWYVIII_18 [Rhodococcus phage ChewyVIII]|uniref:Uncharacterized protein n=1 Tax=Rhodococcus phage ChewyVIII TaxID=1887657 RepID=A0A1C9EI33_9CAUD|nr:hypothetical protein QEH30_gp18 [Rhodococcus phage ChewyVIII]AON97441.1 hypothetical protein SEA_CHEWYVIII_18 [Rhodococcus phage ChewyVIII]
MRFVDIDEIYRRIEEEHDHLAKSYRFDDPVRASCKGLRKALHMMDNYILEQEKADAKEEKGREVFLRKLARDQHDRLFTRYYSDLDRILSGGGDGVPDHPDAPEDQREGPGDDESASWSGTGLEEAGTGLAAVGVDGESVVFAYPQPDGTTRYESTRIRSVVIEDDLVTISTDANIPFGGFSDLPLGFGLGEEVDRGDEDLLPPSEAVREYCERLRTQAAILAEDAQIAPLVFNRWLPTDFPQEEMTLDGTQTQEHSGAGAVAPGLVQTPDGRGDCYPRESRGIRESGSGVRSVGGAAAGLQPKGPGRSPQPEAQPLVDGAIARGLGSEGN